MSLPVPSPLSSEQKGTTEDGKVPDNGDEPVVPVGRKLIASMKNTYWDYSGSGIEADGDEVVNFFYDDRLRLTKMVVNTWDETAEPSPKQIPGATAASSVTTRTRIPVTITAVIAYGDRSASYEITREENGAVDPHNTQTGSVELDEAGRAVSGKYLSYDDDKGEGEWIPYSDMYELSYDDAGYLVKSVSSQNGEERITWTGGNPTEVWWGLTGDGQDFIDKASYGTVPNKTNLDLNWFFVLEPKAGPSLREIARTSSRSSALRANGRSIWPKSLPNQILSDLPATLTSMSTKLMPTAF